MSIFSCTIELTDYNDDSLYLFRRIGGQPKTMVPVLSNALALGRRGLTIQDFAARIAGTLGPEGCRSLSIHASAEPLTEFPHNFRYSITFEERILIRVYEISDGGEKELYYEGLLENYLTKELRKPKPRRGRPPVGYLDKDEQNREAIPKTRNQVVEEILRERERDGLGMLPDLRGVKETTHINRAIRRNARNAEKIRSRKNR